MIKNKQENITILFVFLLIGLFWYFAFSNQKLTINSPPEAFDTKLSIKENTNLSVNIVSLVRDVEGERIKYATLIDLPKNGNITLNPVYGKAKKYIFHSYKNKDNINKKFDPNRIRINYVPKLGYSGKDSFKFVAYDFSGNKSNVANVDIIIDNLNIQINSPPIVFEKEYLINTKQSLHINLQAMSIDLDGELIEFNNRISPNDFTIRNVDYGLIEGYEHFNYLPKIAGIENLTFKSYDESMNVTNSKIKITIENAPANYSSSLKNKILNFKEYILFIPKLKSFTIIMMISWFVFFFAFTILLFLKYYFVENLFLKKILLSIKNNHIIYILLLLNSSILYFHTTILSLPPYSLDYSFVDIYYIYKENILTQIHPHHQQRILIPFFASLLNFNDPVIAFKVVNTIFFNLSVLVFYKLWRALEIKTYLFYIGLFFMIIGPVRFYFFWPTGIDSPSIFFTALFLYIILNKQFIWLLILGPIACLQHEAFLLHLLVILFYQIYLLLTNNKSKKNYNNLMLIFISIFLVFLFKNFFIISDPIESNSLALLSRLRINMQSFFGGDNYLKLMKLPIIYFGVFGITLFLLFMNNKKKIIYNEVMIISILCILFYIIMVTFVSGNIHTRTVFLIFSFVMTLVLFKLKDVSFNLVLISVILSLPLLRLFNFPFNDPVMLESATNSSSSIIGFYIVISSFIIYFINNTRFLDIANKFQSDITKRINL